MAGFISYNAYKQQYPLNETYESYVELEKLAEDIYNRFNVSSFFKKLKVHKLYDLSKFIKKDFRVLRSFIKDYALGILYVAKHDDKAGAYFLTHEQLPNIIKDLYNGLIVINRLEKSYILHELQHAYDDYRSTGKFINQKKLSKYKASKELPNTMSNDTFTQIKYYRLPHELDAKFIDTLSEVDFFYDEKQLIMKDIKTAWEDFIKHFKVYKIVTPKQQKLLARRFSQYYHKLKERNIAKE